MDNEDIAYLRLETLKAAMTITPYTAAELIANANFLYSWIMAPNLPSATVHPFTLVGSESA